MDIVVVGGGTAGWLTALFAQRCYPEDNISVIEDDDLGILGAGEGTTPQIMKAMDFLGIPLTDFIRFADATIKHSIRFTNWTGDGSSYHHSFTRRSDLAFSSNTPSPRDFITRPTDDQYLYQHKLSDPYEAHDICSFLGATFKVPFSEIPADLSTVANPINLFEQVGTIAVHFNAVRLASLLKEIAKARGVNHIEGLVVDVIENEYGNIKSLKLKDGKNVSTDFVFDCSGFHRIIIGKHFKSEWRSFSDFLPANRAIGYFKPIKRPTPAFTEAIAMKNGWSWQIPLQTRWGSGYVYSDAYTTEDDVRKEIEEREGNEVEWGKTFKFDPGYYKQTWVKNCVALGLSSGFLEPLEATSIMQTLISMESVMGMRIPLLDVPQNEKDKFNNFVCKTTESIADFLYLHYLSDRQDTDFWRQFHRKSTNMPDSVKEILEICKYRFPEYGDFEGDPVWDVSNYNAIIDGNEIIPHSKYESLLGSLKLNRMQDYISLKRNVQIAGARCVNHDYFLSMVR